jgi:IS5 family transposase
MTLKQTWYNMSDPEVEDMVNDSLGAMRFCGLSLEDSVPDHSTISRFRTELVRKKAHDRILKKINHQLKGKGIMIKQGSSKVDATITESPFKPKGKTTYEIAQDRREKTNGKRKKNTRNRNNRHY